MVLPLVSVRVVRVLLKVERMWAIPRAPNLLFFFDLAALMIFQLYFNALTDFLPATVFLGPLRERAFVLVR